MRTLLATERLADANERDGQPVLLTEDYMAKMYDQGAPDHVINVKIGALMVCLRNIQGDARVLNGTRLKLLSTNVRDSGK